MHSSFINFFCYIIDICPLRSSILTKNTMFIPTYIHAHIHTHVSLVVCFLPSQQWSKITLSFWTICSHTQPHNLTSFTTLAPRPSHRVLMWYFLLSLALPFPSVYSIFFSAYFFLSFLSFCFSPRTFCCTPTSQFDQQWSTTRISPGHRNKFLQYYWTNC